MGCFRVERKEKPIRKKDEPFWGPFQALQLLFPRTTFGISLRCGHHLVLRTNIG